MSCPQKPGAAHYLSSRFGEDRIFFDRSTIESGDVFPESLRQGVERCAVLLALIGPEWLARISHKAEAA
jgi:hypothetical protein